MNEYKIILKPRIDDYYDFEIESNESNLRNLKFEVIAKNAYQPNLFQYIEVKEFDN